MKSKCLPLLTTDDVINDVINGHSRPDPDDISWRCLMQCPLPTGTVTSSAGDAKAGGLPFVLLDIHSCRIGFERFWEGVGQKMPKILEGVQIAKIWPPMSLRGVSIAPR